MRNEKWAMFSENPRVFTFFFTILFVYAMLKGEICIFGE